MIRSISGYYLWALGLWGAISVLLGVSLAAWMGLEGRMRMLAVVIVVGLYGLVAIRLAARSAAHRLSSMEGMEAGVSNVKEGVSGLSEHGLDPLVERLLAEDGVMEPDQVVDWLDSFLVRQQESVR